jgi:hypothetical protein
VGDFFNGRLGAVRDVFGECVMRVRQKSRGGRIVGNGSRFSVRGSRILETRGRRVVPGRETCAQPGAPREGTRPTTVQWRQQSTLAERGYSGNGAGVGA